MAGKGGGGVEGVEMMRCPKCQFENREGVKFCEQCGAKVELTCPACGSSVPPDRKFCGACGQSRSFRIVSGWKVHLPSGLHPKTSRRKDSDFQGCSRRRAQAGDGAVRRYEGLMELLADRDPEEARKLLDPILEHMMEAVHRYEGTVNQVMGDGIMALFGAPLGPRGSRGAGMLCGA